jgi:hypothetical protein
MTWSLSFSSRVNAGAAGFAGAVLPLEPLSL